MHKHADEQGVTVQEMMHARDIRVQKQRALLETHHAPVISLSMNIAGAIKRTPLIERAFDVGLSWIAAQTAPFGGALDMCITREKTGPEALLSVRADAREIKRRLCAMEEATPLGRLMDMDVIDVYGEKIAREDIGLPMRRCLLCEGVAAACARSRTHSAEALFARAQEIITAHFENAFAQAMAQTAQRALLYEVATTPKPGLVDCRNNGAHKDMDIFTFLDSACVLTPYFEQCTALGLAHRGKAPAACFAALRTQGVWAEAQMYKATVGVNTHKGAIFSLGIFCAALGMGYVPGEGADAVQALLRCGAMTKDALAAELGGITQENARTFGERLYAAHGLAGVRGEAAGGFASVREIALPTLHDALLKGDSLQAAGVRVLLALLAQTQDTNVIRRSDRARQQRLAKEAQALLHSGAARKDIEALDAQLIKENISPGGCADLLALTYMAYWVQTREAL